MLNRLRDVFACLQKHDVRYVVIGGIAAVLHGVPRATFDLDILIEATKTNVQNLLDAFLEAKRGTAALTSADEIIAHEISIFQDRIRIDMQTRAPGIEFAKAWENKIEMNYQGQSFFILCKNDLIAAKLAAGRDEGAVSGWALTGPSYKHRGTASQRRLSRLDSTTAPPAS